MARREVGISCERPHGGEAWAKWRTPEISIRETDGGAPEEIHRGTITAAKGTWFVVAMDGSSGRVGFQRLKLAEALLLILRTCSLRFIFSFYLFWLKKGTLL